MIFKCLGHFLQRLPSSGANLGSFWFFVYFLSQAAPQTTRLLRPLNVKVVTSVLKIKDDFNHLLVWPSSG